MASPRTTAPHAPGVRRLFVALPLPADFATRLTPPPARPHAIHWIRPAQAHVTLRFVGEVDDAIGSALVDRLGAIRASSFTTAVTGTGVFPNLRKARVLWLGLQNHAQLRELQRQVEATVIASGLERETRPYVPHITLARTTGVAPHLAEAVMAPYTALAGTLLQFDEMRLYASHLNLDGAHYEIIKSYALR